MARWTSWKITCLNSCLTVFSMSLQWAGHFWLHVLKLKKNKSQITDVLWSCRSDLSAQRDSLHVLKDLIHIIDPTISLCAYVSLGSTKSILHLNAGRSLKCHSPVEITHNWPCSFQVRAGSSGRYGKLLWFFWVKGSQEKSESNWLDSSQFLLCLFHLAVSKPQQSKKVWIYKHSACPIYAVCQMGWNRWRCEKFDPPLRLWRCSSTQFVKLLKHGHGSRCLKICLKLV